MSDMPASALVGMLVPKLPFLLKTALLSALSLSPNASKWDLRTELIVAILRSELSKSPPATISEQQRSTTQVPKVKGPMWVSKVTFPAPPETDIRRLLVQAVNDLGTGTERYDLPPLCAVEGEWHGYRAHTSKEAPEPVGLSEADKYEHMMREVRSDAVVLYLHGGAYFLMDASSQRPTTAGYAQMLSGRTFAVRYRLAPQNPFPAALLDAVAAYVSLLHPPPGALHRPVPAHKILLAGDSAGGNLALALMQLLLHWHHASPCRDGEGVPTLDWHGDTVRVPLPAGMALSSPWTDLTRSLPSQQTNRRYDYLPAAESSGAGHYPPCAAWPTRPPRAHLFADASTLLHPLASPAVAPPAAWAGCPPALFIVGEEMMADEAAVVATRVARAQAAAGVCWLQFEAMPHCFGLVLEDGHAAGVMRERWRNWAMKAIDRPEDLRGFEGSLFAARTLVATPIDVAHLTDLEDERALELMRNTQRALLSEKDGRHDAEGEMTPIV